jgi:Rrf2 family protein
MQLSRSVTYALQALLQLAESGQGVLVNRWTLAANGQMPERFLREILHDLVQCGILSSSRGGGGGFTLARRPEDITLLSVIEAVDGPLPVGLPAGNSLAELPRDWLGTNLEQVAEGTRAGLAGITLKRLLAAGLGSVAEKANPPPLPASISTTTEGEHSRRSHQAIDAEKVPTATLQPTGEPPQGQQTGQESTDHP